MSTQINQATINTITVLWKQHIPIKTIAMALDLQYPSVAMYIRALKVTHIQFTPKEAVAAILLNTYEPANQEHIDAIIAEHTGQTGGPVND